MVVYPKNQKQNIRRAFNFFKLLTCVTNLIVYGCYTNFNSKDLKSLNIILIIPLLNNSKKIVKQTTSLSFADGIKVFTKQNHYGITLVIVTFSRAPAKVTPYFLLIVSFIEANRDLRDWSGKKPHDYQRQIQSVSSSTYSSEYQLLPFDPNNNPYGTLNLRRHTSGVNRMSTSRHSLNTFPSQKYDHTMKLRRNRTLLTHKTYKTPSEMGRNESFSSGTSNDSAGRKSRRDSENSIEELFRMKPEQRMEKKYKSFMKKKLDKAFGGK